MIIFSPFSPFQLVSFFNPTISKSWYIILKCKSIKNEFMQFFVIKKHANTFYSTFYLNVIGQSQHKIKMQNISIFFPAIYISLRFFTTYSQITEPVPNFVLTPNSDMLFNTVQDSKSELPYWLQSFYLS